MPDSSLPGPAMPEDSRTFREILASQATARMQAGAQATPGQAAYEARVTAQARRLICAGESSAAIPSWYQLSPAERADEDAAARAVMLMAQASVDYAELTSLRAEAASLREQLAQAHDTAVARAVQAERDRVLGSVTGLRIPLYHPGNPGQRPVDVVPLDSLISLLEGGGTIPPAALDRIRGAVQDAMDDGGYPAAEDSGEGGDG